MEYHAWASSNVQCGKRCQRPVELGNQAMETAMKASKKISTAPASGNTTGISGTTASTASVEVASCGCAGADMGQTFN
jgi:hypothetical protein